MRVVRTDRLVQIQERSVGLRVKVTPTTVTALEGFVNIELLAFYVELLLLELG